MSDEKSKRTGRDRTADYRARLSASGEPPHYVVASAFLRAVVEARLNGEGALQPDLLIERATESVTSDPRYTQEGFDNVLARFAQPVNRRPRLT